MHTNPNNFGQNFYKNTDAQVPKINTTAEEYFQEQTMISKYQDVKIISRCQNKYIQ